MNYREKIIGGSMNYEDFFAKLFLILMALSLTVIIIINFL